MVNNKKNSFVSQIIYDITKNVSIKKIHFRTCWGGKVIKLPLGFITLPNH